MTPLRVAFVTRRFWPYAGGPEVTVARLVRELTADDFQATVVTGGSPAWPDRIEYNGAPVIRLSAASIALWGGSYTRALSRWLKQNRRDFDVVCVSELKHEAQAVLAVARQSKLAVALRAERGGMDGDCHWQLNAHFGQRIKRSCFAADAVIAPNRAVEQELIAAGYPRQRIQLCQTGVPRLPQRTPEKQQAARRALADANSTLLLPDGALVGVFLGTITAAKQLEFLVSTWEQMLSQQANAYLWIVGDGPYRDELARRIAQRRLTGRMVLPGTFDDVSDILMAADVLLQPSSDAGLSTAILEAMAAGLPVVASDTPGHREAVIPDETGLLPVAGQADLWQQALGALWQSAPLRQRLGEAARQRAATCFSLEQMTLAHRTLFDRLARPSLEHIGL